MSTCLAISVLYTRIAIRGDSEFTLIQTDYRHEMA